jgi:beta-glucosidase
LEWSRLEPENGKWDKSAFEHYKKYISELNNRGIEPFLNIWHWTLPLWFSEKGRFAKRANIKYFERFVQKISNELLGDINFVITLNEPNVYIGMSYSQGEWPPQKKNMAQALLVYNNLKLAHKSAYKIIKKSHPKIQIGVAQQLANIQAYRPGNLLDEAVVKFMRYFWNWWWLNRIKNQQDFIGFNYYFTDYYKGFHKINPTSPVNDLGWYMNPQGILPLIQRIAYHYPDKPIIITENGVADSSDQERLWWLHETIKALDTAKSQGLPLKGYLHWSLLDNFEWAYGWWPKFGLIEVDRENNMKRKPRPSALWYKQAIAKRQEY